MQFIQGLDNDLKQAVMKQLRDIWTHTSTALEGNTITLGETSFILNEGLTIGGKTLREHQEVVGHARAIDLLYDLLKRNTPVTEQDLFLLHKAVQTQVVTDIFAPVGEWKNEPNGTYGRDSQDNTIFINFASPTDVPALMSEWLGLLNQWTAAPMDEQAALQAYASLHVSFVWIHPFADGNGRMARLLANMPILKAGLPPIVIVREQREAYLRLLNRFNEQVGTATKNKPVIPPLEAIEGFREFCRNSWQPSMAIVEQARQIQATRQG